MPGVAEAFKYDVSRLGLTPEIQDFMYYATQTGRRFDLYVRQGAVLS